MVNIYCLKMQSFSSLIYYSVLVNLILSVINNCSIQYSGRTYYIMIYKSSKFQDFKVLYCLKIQNSFVFINNSAFSQSPTMFFCQISTNYIRYYKQHKDSSIDLIGINDQLYRNTRRDNTHNKYSLRGLRYQSQILYFH